MSVKRLPTMAMMSWNNGPRLTGAVRDYKDHKAKCIVIETTKDNPAGAGLEVCRLEMGCVNDARAITALPELLESVEPFAALGRELAEADGDAPLITDLSVKLEITVGDLQRVAAACARVFPPISGAPEATKMRSLRKRFRPKG